MVSVKTTQFFLHSKKKKKKDCIPIKLYFKNQIVVRFSLQLTVCKPLLFTFHWEWWTIHNPWMPMETDEKILQKSLFSPIKEWEGRIFPSHPIGASGTLSQNSLYNSQYTKANRDSSPFPLQMGMKSHIVYPCLKLSKEKK